MLRASAARRGARTRLYGVYHFPEEVIRRIADFRISEKSDPLHYARLTVRKAEADIGRESLEATN